MDFYGPTEELDTTTSTGLIAEMKQIDPAQGAKVEQDWLDGKIKFAKYYIPTEVGYLYDTLHGISDYNTIAVNAEDTSYAWACVLLHEYDHCENSYPPPQSGHDVTTESPCGETCTHAIKTGRTVNQLKGIACSGWSIPFTQLMEMCQEIEELIGTFAALDVKCQEYGTTWMCEYPINMPDVSGECEVCELLGF
jgi:hypothetical protein